MEENMIKTKIDTLGTKVGPQNREYGKCGEQRAQKWGEGQHALGGVWQKEQGLWC